MGGGIGGLDALVARNEANLAAVGGWVEATPWVEFLVAKLGIRSCTSISLKIVELSFASLPAEEQSAAAKKISSLLEEEGAACDINSLPCKRPRAFESGEAPPSKRATSKPFSPGSTGSLKNERTLVGKGLAGWRV